MATQQPPHTLPQLLCSASLTPYGAADPPVLIATQNGGSAMPPPPVPVLMADMLPTPANPRSAAAAAGRRVARATDELRQFADEEAGRIVPPLSLAKRLKHNGGEGAAAVSSIDDSDGLISIDAAESHRTRRRSRAGRTISRAQRTSERSVAGQRNPSRSTRTRVIHYEALSESSGDAVGESGSDMSDWEAAERNRNRAAERRAERAARRAMVRADNFSDEEEDDVEEEDDWDGDNLDFMGHNLQSRPKRARRNLGEEGQTGHRHRQSERTGRHKTRRNYKLYLPTKWISSCWPAPTPYSPQHHDEVVYLRQGHAEYITACKANQLHKISDKSVPWKKFPALRAVEYCQVEELEYEIGPPSVCVQRLSILRNPALEGKALSLRHRDAANVEDFVVLKERFELAMSTNWQPGHRFRACIDNVWWYGTVSAHVVHDIRFELSPWKSLRVQWDGVAGDEAFEAMSPWEIEKIPDDDCNRTPNTSFDATAASECDPSVGSNGERANEATADTNPENDTLRRSARSLTRAAAALPDSATAGEGAAVTDASHLEPTSRGLSASSNCVVRHSVVVLASRSGMIAGYKPEQAIGAAERDRLLAGLDRVSRLPISDPFRWAVDTR